MKAKLRKSGKIIIDGCEFCGQDIQVFDGKVLIDGVQQDYALSHETEIIIHGDVDRLENDNGIVIARKVGSIHTHVGNVKCDTVYSSVKTISGDVQVAGIVAGSISSVSGNISR